MSLHEFDNRRRGVEGYSDITLEEFESMKEKHDFSEKYRAKKEKLLEVVREKEVQDKDRKRYLYRTAAVAAATVILIPGTAYAANRIYHIAVEKNRYQTNVHVEKDAAKENEDGKLHVPVKMELNYLPEGSVEKQEGSWKFGIPEDEKAGNYTHSTSFEITKIDVDDYTFTELFSTGYKEFEVNGHQAVLIQKANHMVFDKVMYVSFEDYGYVVHTFLENDITDDEAVKIAEGIILTETDKANAVMASSLKKILEQEAEKGGDNIQASDIGEMDNEWHNIGEWLDKWEEDPSMSSGYQYKVTKTEILDDINGLEQKYFDDYGWERLQEVVDGNGNLTTYERKNIVCGDGVNTLDTYGNPETVQKKLVYLTLEIARKPDKAGNEFTDEYCVYFPIRFLKTNENGETEEAAMNEEPVYFDASLAKNTDSHYYWIKLDRGEKVTCHLGYLVDEDRLDEMYLSTLPSGNENVFIDIRQ